MCLREVSFASNKDVKVILMRKSIAFLKLTHEKLD